MILLEFRDFYTKGRGTDCKAAVRALTGVIIVLLVIETHHLKEEEEEEEERDRKPLDREQVQVYDRFRQVNDRVLFR